MSADRARETMNGSRIKVARELRMLDRWELATALGVTVPVLVAAETNQKPLDRKHIDLLCFTLDFPPKWFYLDDLPELPLGSLAWH